MEGFEDKRTIRWTPPGWAHRVFALNCKMAFERKKMECYLALKDKNGNWVYEKMEKWPFKIR